MNNIFDIFKLFKSGGNPQQMIMSMIQQNPQLQSLLKDVNMNNPQDMKKACQNLCQMKGVDYDTMVELFKKQM